LAKDLKYAPIRAFILIYIVLIVIGFVALLLPGAATRPLTNIESLFTCISAITLTGLQVCNFADIFTFQGQLIVLILIECGSITIISFSLYFGWLLGKAHLFTDSVDLLKTEISPLNAYLKILRKTVIYLLFFELVCSGILYAFWTGVDIHFSVAEKLKYAFFHGISVFCHSGFSNLEGNFSNPHVSHSYLLLLALTGVIVLGSIGYAAMFDLISIKRLRERMLDPHKNWTLQTRVALYSTVILIAGGSIIWFIMERNHALKGQKLVEAAFTAIFNVTGARSAGFYSVPVSMVGYWIMILYMLLMVIGSSTSSPGGGIKTSMFYKIGKSPSNLSNLNSFGIFAAGVIIVSILALYFTNPLFSLRSIKFEMISAFTNTGLSYGITPTLSAAGKYILMADMILGRLGFPILMYLYLKRKPGVREDVLLS